MLQNLLNFRRPGVTRQPGTPVKTMNILELYQQLKTNASLVLVDVRSPAEYAQDGHIAGSRLLPLPMLLQRSNELPTDRPIVCICRSGNRSHVACEQLASLGFTDVVNVTGGMLDWHKAGLPSQ